LKITASVNLSDFRIDADNPLKTVIFLHLQAYFDTY